MALLRRNVLQLQRVSPVSTGNINLPTVLGQDIRRATVSYETEWGQLQQPTIAPKSYQFKSSIVTSLKPTIATIGGASIPLYTTKIENPDIYVPEGFIGGAYVRPVAIETLSKVRQEYAVVFQVEGQFTTPELASPKYDVLGFKYTTQAESRLSLLAQKTILKSPFLSARVAPKISFRFER